MQGNGIFSNLTFSEKRKTILFLLLEKPCTLQEINEYLGVKSPESQPRIKEITDAIDLAQFLRTVRA